MQRQLEQDLIQQFTGEIHRRFARMHAQDCGIPHVVASALGAQDRELSDYLFAANGWFSLIEFKDTHKQIATELDKDLRRLLLDAFARDSRLLARAQDIHHLAWGSQQPVSPSDFCGISSERVITVAQYASKLAATIAYPLTFRRAKEWPSGSFITEFMESKTAGSNQTRFKRYLEELYLIAGKNSGAALEKFEGAVLIYYDDGQGISDPIRTVRFHGFEHLMQLTIGYDRHRAQEQSPDQDLQR